MAKHFVNSLRLFPVCLFLFVFTGCAVQAPPAGNASVTAQKGGYYVPTKESVPPMNRYKAQLLFADAIRKCKDNFCSQNHWQDGHWWYNLKLMEDPQITDSSFALVLQEDHPVKTLKYKLEYSKLPIPPLAFSVKKGSSIGFPTPKKYEKLWVMGASFEDGKQLLDALFVLKNTNQTAEDKKELEAFGPIAEKYKALTAKPPLNEDARKYLVQATNAADEKRYMDGIDLLAKALAIDPAYPLAHFNRALLWAQVSMYGAAILEMKEYLLLVPDAKDARASQDKIYEWEGKLNK